MDINQLRYYLEVCNCTSISKAAEVIQMSQQGLSLAIRRLEDELGCDLFYRKSNGIVLTDVGKKVRDEAEKLVAISDNIFRICQHSNSQKEFLTVAISTSMISRVPAELQRLLVNGDDNLDIHLIEMYSSECSRAVVKGEADFAIIYGDYDTELLSAITLDTLQQVIIVNRQNPLAACDEISFCDLEGLPFVLPNATTYPTKMFNQLAADAGIKVIEAYESDFPSHTLEIISNNPILVTRLCTVDLANKELLKIKALPVKDVDMSIPINLIYLKKREITLLDRMFIMFLRSIFKI